MSIFCSSYSSGCRYVKNRFKGLSWLEKFHGKKMLESKKTVNRIHTDKDRGLTDDLLFQHFNGVFQIFIHKDLVGYLLIAVDNGGMVPAPQSAAHFL